ncbi:MATE family efflux transporter [Lacrimispora sp. 210928-DFI.3.58]|uniref:MATE family efflux transporter n=1 Tax=Lacrimispora sp. 210928-DFI.3.58 TaxID=2883214 RepID=UPI001D08234D|nr:MATE family efflux transporter [Lacrimispora sp. 210928-DFI.3.58]MCB7320432.1 MATE family efflux transporter [Lacrimispora sp. 210928-DFI.3.58]
MNQNKALFEDAPIPKAVAVMAVPTMISMLVVVIYNMADTFFIGQTGDPMQVAAVSLATPVFMVFMALGNLFGIGGSSAISRSLGEKKLERARNISSFCCYSSLGLGVLMAVLFLIGMDAILKLIGASEYTVGFAREYLTYIAFGGPFIMFGTAFGNILRGEGAAKESMIGNMIGTVTNIVLDPIMILFLGWGVAGAAIATVIGNIAASAYYVCYFLRKRSSLSIRFQDFSTAGRIPFSVASIGIPASLNNILMSCANIVLNLVLVSYGDTPVAAMGVALKSNMLVVLLQIGLCAGIQPLIGYNYGSGNKKRLKQVFWFTGLCAVIMGTALTLLMVVARRFVIQAFINDADVISYGIQMVIALQLSGPVIGILFLCINTLQGMGKALPSLVLTICRQGLIFIPAVCLLNRIFGLDGVIYAQPTADFLSIVLSVVLCMHIFHKMEGSENLSGTSDIRL